MWAVFLLFYTLLNGCLIIFGVYSQVSVLVAYFYDYSTLSYRHFFLLETVVYDFLYLVYCLVATLGADLKLLQNMQTQADVFCLQTNCTWVFRMTSAVLLTLNFLEFSKKSIFNWLQFLLTDLLFVVLYECLLLFIWPSLATSATYFIFCRNNDPTGSSYPNLQMDLIVAVPLCMFFFAVTIATGLMLFVISRELRNQRSTEQELDNLGLNLQNDLDFDIEDKFNTTDLELKSARARSRSQAKISREMLRYSALRPRVDAFGCDEKYSPEICTEPTPADDPVFQSVLVPSTSQPWAPVTTTPDQGPQQMTMNNTYLQINATEPQPTTTLSDDETLFSDENERSTQKQIEQKPITTLAGCVIVYIVVSVQNLACIFLIMIPHLPFNDSDTWVKNFTIICSFLTLLSCVIKRLIYYETIPLLQNLKV